MLCPKCNTMNLDSDNFCVKCGAPLTSPVQQSAAPQPPTGQPYPISGQQPSTGQPYPISRQQAAAPQQTAGQPYPVSGQPYPVSGQQPSTGQPYPISRQQSAAPQQAAGQSYPVSGQQPLTGQPYPVSGQQPLTGQPYPISRQQAAAPQQAAGQPYPISGQPYPISGQSYPISGQSYPISGEQPAVSQQAAGQPYAISGSQPVTPQPPAGQSYPTSGQYAAAPQQTSEQPKPTFHQPLTSPQTPQDQQYIPPVQRNTPPQYAGQPYTAEQKPKAQPAQQKTAQKPQARPVKQDFSQYAEAASSAPASADKPKKSKKAVVALIVVIVLVLLVVGGFLYLRFSGKDIPLKWPIFAGQTTQDAAATTETAEETVSQDTESTLQSDETTETNDLSQQSATEGAFSELHGRWLDQNGDFEMYITSDGTFDLVMPDGLFTGQLEKSDTEYQMKKISKPEYLKNSYIVLHQEGSLPSIELHTEETSATLDFESIPEKDENTDWLMMKPKSETESLFPNSDKLIIDSEESASEWMLIASYPMRDVKILALDQVYGSSDDKVTYETQVMNSVSAVLSSCPLMLKISFTEDTPTRGVSFVGVDNKTHRLAFSYNKEANTVTCEEF